MAIKAREYNFQGMLIKDRIDPYIDSLEAMANIIDQRIERFPLDKRKTHDKQILSYIGKLKEQTRFLEETKSKKGETRDLVYLARELTFGYIYALSSVSSYKGKENENDFANRLSLEGQIRKIDLAIDLAS